MKQIFRLSLLLCFFLVFSAADHPSLEPKTDADFVRCMCTYKLMEKNGSTYNYWYQCYGGSKMQCGTRSTTKLVSVTGSSWERRKAYLEGLCDGCSSFEWDEAAD